MSEAPSLSSNPSVATLRATLEREGWIPTEHLLALLSAHERLSIGSRGNVWEEVRALRRALTAIRDFRCSSFRTYQQDAEDMQSIARIALSAEPGPSDETTEVKATGEP